MISIQVVLYMSIATLEQRVVHNNVDCVGDNFENFDVSPSFEIVLAKSKIHQDWTIVYWHNEAGDWTQ